MKKLVVYITALLAFLLISCSSEINSPVSSDKDSRETDRADLKYDFMHEFQSLGVRGWENPESHDRTTGLLVVYLADEYAGISHMYVKVSYYNSSTLYFVNSGENVINLNVNLESSKIVDISVYAYIETHPLAEEVEGPFAHHSMFVSREVEWTLNQRSMVLNTFERSESESFMEVTRKTGDKHFYYVGPLGGSLEINDLKYDNIVEVDVNSYEITRE
jgi:hypothetical protein